MTPPVGLKDKIDVVLGLRLRLVHICLKEPSRRNYPN